MSMKVLDNPNNIHYFIGAYSITAAIEKSRILVILTMSDDLPESNKIFTRVKID